MLPFYLYDINQYFFHLMLVWKLSGQLTIEALRRVMRERVGSNTLISFMHSANGLIPFFIVNEKPLSCVFRSVIVRSKTPKLFDLWNDLQFFYLQAGASMCLVEFTCHARNVSIEVHVLNIRKG
ncbi:unnamed protein product [Vicia faba]|uniref:Uncharacterized protein n=1 Tax=Vicia faba TaxID=3906 RepID=A0AAV0ZJ27_VICFA|nr:unnamed protein product [Vicia faba]